MPFSFKKSTMFDFEKLDLYGVVRSQNLRVLKLIPTLQLQDKYLEEHWKKASLRLLLDFVEGTGAMNSVDKKHFFSSARGCVFECTALLQLLLDLGLVQKDEYSELYASYEQISKMLLGMYNKA